MWSGISATASLLLDKSNSYTLAMHTNGIYVSSSFQLPQVKTMHGQPVCLLTGKVYTLCSHAMISLGEVWLRH